MTFFIQLCVSLYTVFDFQLLVCPALRFDIFVFLCLALLGQCLLL